MKARMPLNMTKSEKKAMVDEIKRQILEKDKNYSMETDAMILWTLHCFAGWGKRKLKAFWNKCFEEHQRLREFYEMDPEDDGWLYKVKLKSIGVDIEEWYNDIEKGEKK